MPTLNHILGGVPLSGTIKRVAGGIPADGVPPAFMRVTSRKKGKLAEWIEVDDTRQSARRVHYGSPSINVSDIPGVRKRSFEFIHTFEHILHEPATLADLQNPDPMLRNLAEQTIARDTEQFAMRFVNHRLTGIYSALVAGRIRYDREGNLVDPNAVSSAVDVDFGVPAGNRDQLDVDGSGDIIDASWALSGTPIATHIRRLKKAAVRLSGYRIKHAFYAENLLEFILDNNQLSAIINRNDGFQTMALAGEIPPVLNLQWHPIDDLFFEDQNGDIVELVTADTVVFTPDPSPEWWEVIEGSFPVPRNFNISADALAAVSNMTEENGMFSYATMLPDPPSIKQLAGDTFLPVLKVPRAIFIADVTP